jgi:hypothetical protein
MTKHITLNLPSNAVVGWVGLKFKPKQPLTYYRENIKDGDLRLIGR